MPAFAWLNVNEDADDAAIKTAYLAAVRQYPPESHPEMFNLIRAAYEAIATPRQRLHYQLFSQQPVTAEMLLLLLLRAKGKPQLDDHLFRRIVAENLPALLTNPPKKV